VHVLQANLLAAPAGWAPEAVLERWTSVVDIAEIAASGGVRVSVLQAASREHRITRRGIDYHFVDLRGAPGHPARARRLVDAIERLGAHVLHVQGLAFGADAFAVARHLPAMPILCQDHADRVPRRWWRRMRWRRWYRAIPGVAFTAAAQALPFVDAGILGPDTRVFAIPESTSRFTPGDHTCARAQTGLHGDPCIAWVGHLDPGKDPLAVLDGIARAAGRLPGLQLWCAFGTDALLPEVRRRMAASPALSSRVHLLGRVEHAQVEAILRAADLFVSGSHREGSGYALLEALACDATPIVTDIPAFRALTDDGRIGRLWPVGDANALADALFDAWARRACAGEVREHFDATLSFPALGRRWAEAYGQLVESQRRPPP
jgi:glycosyltransferase involved in cell wall biosynthesis